MGGNLMDSFYFPLASIGQPPPPLGVAKQRHGKARSAPLRSRYGMSGAKHLRQRAQRARCEAATAFHPCEARTAFYRCEAALA